MLENEEIDEADRAGGVDAPEPIRRLLESRPGAPVFRYRPDSPNRFTMLRRYYSDRPAQDIAIASPQFGTGVGQLPRYLLIYGSPEAIPWELQYQLNAAAAVGRLDLEGELLDNYVAALMTGWGGSSAEATHVVVWATDHGGDDMSGVMKRVIAEKVYDRLKRDTDIGPSTRFVGETGGDATWAALTDALSQASPGLVITTSHGKTAPLDDVAAMGQDLGLPVDDDFSVLAPTELLDAWQPDGAIWYAHACCSAGAGDRTIYEGLLEADSEILKVLNGVAAVGSRIAPLPKALLGAPKPLRAFIGHVEPTFDWTIQQPKTGQPLTTAIVEALYERLYQPFPVGLAFEPFYDPIGSLAVEQVSLRRAFDRREKVDEQLLACQLSGRDRMSMVILGDPTAALAVTRD